MSSSDQPEGLLKPQESATDILAPIFAHTDVSFFDMVKLQAQVLVPLLKAFRTELGETRANQIASSALREWSRKLYTDIGAQLPGSPRQKWETISTACLSRLGDDVDFAMLKKEQEALEFNITGCRYADFFRQLGEPELGGVLMCDADVDIETVGSPEVEMTRTQTIMKGAEHCDFRYCLKTGGGSEK